MRNILYALCLVAFTYVGCSSETVSTIVAPSVHTLSADGLKQLVDSGQDFVFVDVREDAEIELNGTLKRYIHIPIGRLAAEMSRIPKDKKVVVACASGFRSAQGAALLQKHGYRDVVAVGMAEYQAKGYPLIYPRPVQ